MNIDIIQKISHFNQRNKKSVEIIAITKTHPFEVVVDAYKHGLRHIGENRVEEAINKIDLARQNNINDICWHMIGHVQSRKVRDVVSFFDRVDSVDSIELLQKLNAEAHKQHKMLRVLLEVNISREQTKYGFEEIPKNLMYSNLVIDGLMTMAPYTTNPEDNRWIFKKMKEISLGTPTIGSTLSMGTSCDYTVAIEEGATEVRLGEALFGKRTI